MTTPIELVRHDINLMRQSGRTHRMIMALPNEGHYVIVVWKVGSMRDTIESLRGKAIADAAIFVSHHRAEYTLSQLSNDLPVFVDNAVLDIETEKYVIRMNKCARRQTMRVVNPAKWAKS